MITYLIILVLLLLTIYFYLQKRKIEERIKISAKVISGKAIEKLLPFFKKFKYNAHDLRWIGDPIDYVVFDGYSLNKPKQIIFLEIKTGKSKLTERQKRIKRIIEEKKIKWEEVKIK
jgi:predicted Holliday junction resolvase-like endonuclease